MNAAGWDRDAQAKDQAMSGHAMPGGTQRFKPRFLNAVNPHFWLAQEEAEAAARDRDAQAKDQAVSGHAAPKHTAPKVPEFDEKAEAEYFKLEHKFKIQLGLIVQEERS